MPTDSTRIPHFVQAQLPLEEVIPPARYVTNVEMTRGKFSGRLRSMTTPCPLGLGSRNGYQKRGCRCDECTEANSAYQRDRRGRGAQIADNRKMREREDRIRLEAKAATEARWSDDVREAHARINAAFGLGQARQDEVA